MESSSTYVTVDFSDSHSSVKNTKFVEPIFNQTCIRPPIVFLNCFNLKIFFEKKNIIALLSKNKVGDEKIFFFQPI